MGIVMMSTISPIEEEGDSSGNVVWIIICVFLAIILSICLYTLWEQSPCPFQSDPDTPSKELSDAADMLQAVSSDLPHGGLATANYFMSLPNVLHGLPGTPPTPPTKGFSKTPPIMTQGQIVS